MNGYSCFWLLILFVIGAYLGKFVVSFSSKGKNFIYKIVYSLIFFNVGVIVSYLKLKINSNKINNRILKYDSPIIVSQAISIIMFFTKTNIKNKFLIKVISFFTPLNFNVYLIHDNNIIRRYIISKYIRKIIKYRERKFFFAILLLVAIIYIICALIDFIRYFFFKLLKIKYFCILLEKKIIN